MHSQFGKIPAVVVLTGLEIKFRVFLFRDRDKDEFKCGWFWDVRPSKIGLKTGVETKTNLEDYNTDTKCTKRYIRKIMMYTMENTSIYTHDVPP